MTEQRLGPIAYYDRDGNACGKMKECDDGDYVRFNKYLDEKPTKVWLEEQGFYAMREDGIFTKHIKRNAAAVVDFVVCISCKYVKSEISFRDSSGFCFLGVQTKRDVLRVIEVFSKEIPSED